MERRLFAALAASLLLHFAVVDGPAWRLPPMNVEPDMSTTLQAELVPPHAPAAVVTPLARPAPRPRTAPRRPRPPAPTAETPPVAPAPAPPAAESAPAPAAAPAPAPAESPAAPTAASAPPPEIALPRQGRIRFAVTRGEGGQNMILGQSVHSWRHDGSSYALQTVTETTGVVALFRPLRIVQTSEGGILAGSLAPREFRVERNGEPAEAARLEREAKRVVLLEAGQVRREAALTEGAQDILSQIYQLGLMGRPGRAEMMIATGKNYGRYVFEYLGEERLATRFGALRALHYRTSAAAGEPATELWLASDYRNLPLRIRHIDRKGDIYDQTAVEIEIDGIPLPERAE